MTALSLFTFSPLIHVLHQPLGRAERGREVVCGQAETALRAHRPLVPSSRATLATSARNGTTDAVDQPGRPPSCRPPLRCSPRAGAADGRVPAPRTRGADPRPGTVSAARRSVPAISRRVVMISLSSSGNASSARGQLVHQHQQRRRRSSRRTPSAHLSRSSTRDAARRWRRSASRRRTRRPSSGGRRKSPRAVAARESLISAF